MKISASQAKNTILVSGVFFISPLFSSCATEDSSSLVEASLVNDNLQAVNEVVWAKSDGWSNGLPFLNGWCADNIENDESGLSLTLATTSSTQDCSSEAYASGEYRTKGFYGYGSAEVEMQAASGSGIVSSFFFYTGVSDGNAHEEIGFEILGGDPSRVQVNYWTVESGVETEHPTFTDLGFDASARFHLYAIDWRENVIRWYVDGKLIHEENGSNGKLPVLKMRIFMNLWACDATIWCGLFAAGSLPVQAKYRNFKLKK